MALDSSNRISNNLESVGNNDIQVSMVVTCCNFTIAWIRPEELRWLGLEKS